jgi:hypothetical protein
VSDGYECAVLKLSSRATVFAALALLSASAGCASDDFGASIASGSEAVASDAVGACPIPDVNHIPGNESVFYLCAEQHADFGNGCGPDGYLIGYGTKYSQRFYKQARPRMSTRGQKWIDDVLVCLQHDLREAIDETTSCDDIWSTAFDSHPACYLESGFCTLSPFDIAQVVWTIDAKDIISKDASRQVLQTAIGCGHEYEKWMHFFFWYLLD